MPFEEYGQYGLGGASPGGILGGSVLNSYAQGGLVDAVGGTLSKGIMGGAIGSVFGRTGLGMAAGAAFGMSQIPIVGNIASNAAIGGLLGVGRGLPGIAAGATAGAAGAIATGLLSAGKELVGVWQRLGAVSQDLIRKMAWSNPAIAREAGEWERMQFRTGRRWGEAIAPLLTRVSSESRNFAERWENIKIDLYKQFEPVLNKVVDLLAGLGKSVISIAEFLRTYLKPTFDVLRLAGAFTIDTAMLPFRSAQAVKEWLGQGAPNGPGEDVANAFLKAQAEKTRAQATTRPELLKPDITGWKTDPTKIPTPTDEDVQRRLDEYDRKRRWGQLKKSPTTSTTRPSFSLFDPEAAHYNAFGQEMPSHAPGDSIRMVDKPTTRPAPTIGPAELNPIKRQEPSELELASGAMAKWMKENPVFSKYLLSIGVLEEIDKDYLARLRESAGFRPEGKSELGIPTHWYNTEEKDPAHRWVAFDKETPESRLKDLKDSQHVGFVHGVHYSSKAKKQILQPPRWRDDKGQHGVGTGRWDRRTDPTTRPTVPVPTTGPTSQPTTKPTTRSTTKPTTKPDSSPGWVAEVDPKTGETVVRKKREGETGGEFQLAGGGTTDETPDQTRDRLRDERIRSSQVKFTKEYEEEYAAREENRKEIERAHEEAERVQARWKAEQGYKEPGSYRPTTQSPTQPKPVTMGTESAARAGMTEEQLRRRGPEKPWAQSPNPPQNLPGVGQVGDKTYFKQIPPWYPEEEYAKGSSEGIVVKVEREEDVDEALLAAIGKVRAAVRAMQGYDLIMKYRVKAEGTYL